MTLAQAICPGQPLNQIINHVTRACQKRFPQTVLPREKGPAPAALVLRPLPTTLSARPRPPRAPLTPPLTLSEISEKYRNQHTEMDPTFTPRPAKKRRPKLHGARNPTAAQTATRDYGGSADEQGLRNA